MTETVNHLQAVLRDVLGRDDLTHGLRRAARALRSELDVHGRHLRGQEELATRGLPDDLRHIQIGGGDRLLPGFVNVDIMPPADVVVDVREGIPFPTGCAGLVFMEHVLEHLDYPLSAKHLVRECFRVLDVGGELVIGVPDARMVIKGYLGSDSGLRTRMLHDWYGNRSGKEHFGTYLDLVNYVFRDQDDSDRYTPHLWAYDYEKLAEMCVGAGFRKVSLWPHDPQLANPERKWGSVYAVAVK